MDFLATGISLRDVDVLLLRLSIWMELDMILQATMRLLKSVRMSWMIFLQSYMKHIRTKKYIVQFPYHSLQTLMLLAEVCLAFFLITDRIQRLSICLPVMFIKTIAREFMATIRRAISVPMQQQIQLPLVSW